MTTTSIHPSIDRLYIYVYVYIYILGIDNPSHICILYIYEVASKFGYGSACGFTVWIGALHFDSHIYIYIIGSIDNSSHIYIYYM